MTGFQPRPLECSVQSTETETETETNELQHSALVVLQQTKRPSTPPVRDAQSTLLLCSCVPATTRLSRSAPLCLRLFLSATLSVSASISTPVSVSASCLCHLTLVLSLVLSLYLSLSCLCTFLCLVSVPFSVFVSVPFSVFVTSSCLSHRGFLDVRNASLVLHRPHVQEGLLLSKPHRETPRKNDFAK